MPPITVIRKTTVSSALPAMTIGLRARLEREGRGGIGMSSGCSAARGLRGAIGRGSIGVAPSGRVACSGG